MKKKFKVQTKQIQAISIVTFQELLREKVLWTSFMFSILCVGLAFAVSQLSFSEHARISLDFGLASVAFVGGVISVFMGSTLIAKEVQSRTLYSIITKSIWRWQFVVGRWFGLMGIIMMNAVIMTGIFMAVFFFLGGRFHIGLIQALLLLIFEFGVLASIACVFSAFSTATLSIIFTSGIWILGHAVPEIKLVAEKIEPAFLKPFLIIVSNLIPDLTRFDIKAQVSHVLPVFWSYVLLNSLYGLVYIIFSLVVSCFIFEQRDL
jgi:ABC-type transport system involved in multi-copper enzyme maturation permease subunit